MHKSAMLALEDGSIFHGVSCGYQGETGGEVVFNTAMTGYQEILSDPSYAEQIICFTYPHIGNTGVNNDDIESPNIWAKGLILREVPTAASSWRAEHSLCAYLRQHKIVAIAEIDTRRLTHLLRDKGAMRGVIISGECDEASSVAKAQAQPSMVGCNLANEVSHAQTYHWQQGTWQLGQAAHQSANTCHIVAYDFGVKANILRIFADHDCRLTVVPANTSAKEVLALNPDGIFLSNGPGDPAACTQIITEIQQLLNANIPMFGICLGHQLLALAANAKTVKMKFGHHGANHPVQEIDSGMVMITSQNHGFAVDEHSLSDDIIVTHRSLFDGSLQGMRWRHKPIFGFQGHPEASPGPHDLIPLFAQFMRAVLQGEDNA